MTGLTGPDLTNLLKQFGISSSSGTNAATDSLSSIIAQYGSLGDVLNSDPSSGSPIPSSVLSNSDALQSFLTNSSNSPPTIDTFTSSSTPNMTSQVADMFNTMMQMKSSPLINVEDPQNSGGSASIMQSLLNSQLSSINQPANSVSDLFSNFTQGPDPLSQALAGLSKLLPTPSFTMGTQNQTSNIQPNLASLLNPGSSLDQAFSSQLPSKMTSMMPSSVQTMLQQMSLNQNNPVANFFSSITGDGSGTGSGSSATDTTTASTNTPAVGRYMQFIASIQSQGVWPTLQQMQDELKVTGIQPNSPEFMTLMSRLGSVIGPDGTSLLQKFAMNNAPGMQGNPNSGMGISSQTMYNSATDAMNAMQAKMQQQMQQYMQAQTSLNSTQSRALQSNMMLGGSNGPMSPMQGAIQGLQNALANMPAGSPQAQMIQNQIIKMQQMAQNMPGMMNPAMPSAMPDMTSAGMMMSPGMGSDAMVQADIPNMGGSGAMSNGMPFMNPANMMLSGMPNMGGSSKMPNGMPFMNSAGMMLSDMPNMDASGNMSNGMPFMNPAGMMLSGIPNMGGSGAMPNGMPFMSSAGMMPPGMPKMGANGMMTTAMATMGSGGMMPSSMMMGGAMAPNTMFPLNTAQ